MNDRTPPEVWCRERLLVPGNPLSASLPYASDAHRSGILALHAVIGEIAAIPGQISDPGVGIRKLGWWRDQIAAGATHHPAMQALANHAPDMLSEAATDHWTGLFEGVTATLDNPRFERFEELWQHCREVGGAARALEAHLVGAGAERAGWLDLGAAGYLVRIVRDLKIDAAENRWLVPLDIQAAYQVDRQQVAGGVPAAGFDGLVRDLVERARRQARRFEESLPGTEAWRQRHLMVLAALDTRLAEYLHRHPRRILKQRILPGPFGNAWRAWRTARKLHDRQRRQGDGS